MVEESSFESFGRDERKGNFIVFIAGREVGISRWAIFCKELLRTVNALSIAREEDEGFQNVGNVLTYRTLPPASGKLAKATAARMHKWKMHRGRGKLHCSLDALPSLF